MLRSYYQAEKLLESYIPAPDKKHPAEMGLLRMKLLMEFLGNPQNNYPKIHITGTSGKGSTAAIIASILGTKYKVGLHTSPHLISVRERLQINNKNISEKDFVQLIKQITPVIKRVEESQYSKPTYFEMTAALAFLYFAKEKVDIAVVEVGMGGRFDATNVINPLVSVITNVSRDHTQVLGDTIEKIAEDKAGIIKRNIEVVCAAKQPSVIKIIKDRCRQQKSTLSLLGKEFGYQNTKVGKEGSRFDYTGKCKIKNLKIKLLGEHQIKNASLALRVVELIRNKFPLEEKLIRAGLQQAYIPGRLEIIRQNPWIVLDGAHNGDKAKALTTAIRNIYPDQKITLVVAIKKDKDAAVILHQLLPLARLVICTEFKIKMDVGKICSYKAKELAKTAKAITPEIPILEVKNPREAFQEAKEKTEENDVILVTGSLYLVGIIKNFYF